MVSIQTVPPALRHGRIHQHKPQKNWAGTAEDGSPPRSCPWRQSGAERTSRFFFRCCSFLFFLKFWDFENKRKNKRVCGNALSPPPTKETKKEEPHKAKPESEASQPEARLTSMCRPVLGQACVLVLFGGSVRMERSPEHCYVLATSCTRSS